MDSSFYLLENFRCVLDGAGMHYFLLCLMLATLNDASDEEYKAKESGSAGAQQDGAAPQPRARTCLHMSSTNMRHLMQERGKFVVKLKIECRNSHYLPQLFDADLGLGPWSDRNPSGIEAVFKSSRFYSVCCPYSQHLLMSGYRFPRLPSNARNFDKLKNFQSCTF
eukprot:782716-Amphidinium_carterae.1